MKGFSTVSLFLLVFVFVACGDRTSIDDQASSTSNAESQAAVKQFDDIFDSYIDRDPEWQTFMGIKKDYDQWTPRTDERAQEDLDFAKNVVEQLNKLDISSFDDATLLSYNMLKNQTLQEIEDYKWRNHNYPVNQMFGRHSSLPSFFMNYHKIDNQEDAEAYIKRLDQVDVVMDELLSGLTTREENGIMPPRFVYDHVLRDCRNIITGYPFTNDEEKPSAIWSDFKKKTADFDNQDELLESAKVALQGKVLPGYNDLIDFIDKQKDRASTDDGVWKFPNGEEFYNYALRDITTTDLTWQEIHQIGLDEVDRIHAEMKAIMKKVEFEGELQDFFKFMRDDKQFYYPDTDEGKAAYMADAEAIIDSFRLEIDGLFLTKPKAELIIKAVEPYREQSAGKAFYNRPAPDGSRPGIYYANTYDMSAMPKYQMEALAYHEAIPGHHMQLSIAQEMETLPKFRRYGGNYTAYIEGWGLYSEYIPKELGFYSDPYSDFGRLAMELWRACRLVVDTGIHGKKWTREEGIRYYKTNTPNAESDCIKMVERHIVMPGQATAYKIGMIKILELREKAKTALGDKFDIRDFHEVVITNGAVPLDLLEDLVDDYIATKS